MLENVRKLMLMMAFFICSSCDVSTQPGPSVSIQAILANPSQYVGYELRTFGYLGGDQKGTLYGGIYTDMESAIALSVGIVIRFSDQATEKAFYESCEWNYVNLRGVLLENDYGYYFGQIDNVSKYEFDFEEKSSIATICWEN